MAEGNRGSFRGRTHFDIFTVMKTLHPEVHLLDARYREQEGYVDVRLTLRFPGWKAVHRAFRR